MNQGPTPEVLSASYRASRERLTSLAAGLTPEQEQLNVPTCPAWSVRDLISHNVGLATALAGGQGPSGDVQQWVDSLVAERVDVNAATQLAEWAETGAAFEALLLNVPQMATLVVDVVVHEHDLAGALGTQGDRSAPEIGVILDLITDSVNGDLAQHNLASARFTTPERAWTYGTGDVELEVNASLFETMRILEGRRSLSQMLASDHTGDMERYAPGIVHNPLPESDIVE